MATFDIHISHNLGQDAALLKVKELLPKMKEKFQDKFSNLNEQWTGNQCNFSFNAMGNILSGTLTVNPTEIHLISGTLPFAIAMMKTKVSSVITEEAKRLLAQ